MTDRELMQMALDALEKLNKDGWILADFEDEVYASIEALRARLAQPEQREVEIEFKEWIHPHMGLVPVDPKTPLILKAAIREEV